MALITCQQSFNVRAFIGRNFTDISRKWFHLPQTSEVVEFTGIVLEFEEELCLHFAVGLLFSANACCIFINFCGLDTFSFVWKYFVQNYFGYSDLLNTKHNAKHFFR